MSIELEEQQELLMQVIQYVFCSLQKKTMSNFYKASTRFKCIKKTGLVY